MLLQADRRMYVAYVAYRGRFTSEIYKSEE